MIQSRVDKIEDVCTNFQQTNDSLSEKKFLELFTTVVRIRRAVSRLKITNFQIDFNLFKISNVFTDGLNSDTFTYAYMLNILISHVSHFHIDT